MKQRISGAIWGVVFILAGIGFAGGAFGLWDFDLFFDGWWTFLIIVPCFVSLCTNGFRVSSLIGVGVGVVLLLSAQGLLPSRIIGNLIVPFILVAIGVNILVGRFWRDNNADRQSPPQTPPQSPPQSPPPPHGFQSSGTTSNSPGYGSYTAIFSGREERVTGIFEGAEMTGIFGAVELDLRDAVIDHDISINATAIFGGVEIRLPRNVRVKVAATPILGGVTNKTGEPSPAMAFPTVYVNAVCVCGGIDIKD